MSKDNQNEFKVISIADYVAQKQLDRVKLYGTIAFVIFISLLANGVISCDAPKRPLPAAMATASLMDSEPPRLVAAEPAGMPANIQLIPDGLGNYRSAALTREELQAALATGKIKYVLRMNGDSQSDQGPLSTEVERYLVTKAGAQYVMSETAGGRSLGRFDAHAGYREGRGYVKAFERATLYLRRGGVLIHCRHGFDRTGAIVGAWLAANGHDFQTIIDHNNWHGYAERGEGYLPYLETVRGQLVKQ